MVKYRNPREVAEMQEMEEAEQEEKIMAEEPVSAEEAVWKERYSNLRRHQNEQQSRSEARITELERKLDQAMRGQIKAPKSQEELERWAAEYPEFAGILETFVSERISNALSDVNEKIERTELRQRELDAQEAFLQLEKLHPDLDKLLARDSDFRKWLEKQPQKYKDKMSGLDVDEASLVIDKYKATNKTKTKNRDEEGSSSKDAARVVRTSTVAQEVTEDFGDYLFSESQIDRESRKNSRWFEMNEDKILEAMRQGKVLLDLSGGAR